MKYDTILVLGSGIRPDGSLPDSAKALVKKAVELYEQGLAPRVIFSGRWSYTLSHTPPITEAEAMANYAKELGLPEQAIHLEDESITTITNLCLLKEYYLEPHLYKRILLVSLDLLVQRTLFNAHMVFDSSYTIDVKSPNFSYPPEKQKSLIEQEKKKLVQAQLFHKHNQPGNHRAIYQAAMKDLEENYLPRQ